MILEPSPRRGGAGRRWTCRAIRALALLLCASCSRFGFAPEDGGSALDLAGDVAPTDLPPPDAPGDRTPDVTLDPAVLVVSEGGLIDFGAAFVDGAVARTLTLRNTTADGHVATALSATLGDGFLWSGGSYPGSGGDCGDVLASGASCELVVRFAPATRGTAAGSLVVDYHDGAAAASLHVDLEAEGVVGAPGTLDVQTFAGCGAAVVAPGAKVKDFQYYYRPGWPWLKVSDRTFGGIAAQPDGAVVLAGSADNGTDHDFRVVRLRRNGAPDPTFGAGGVVTTPIGAADDYAGALGIQADGAIVVAGTTELEDKHTFAVVRYDAGGALDPGFGDGGKAVYTFDDYNLPGDARALLIQPDGAILVAGTTSVGDMDYLLARYNSDGSLDTSFDVDGVVNRSMGLKGGIVDVDHCLAIDRYPDGRIAIGGQANNGSGSFFHYGVGRLDAAGAGSLSSPTARSSPPAWPSPGAPGRRPPALSRWCATTSTGASTAASATPAW